jgi:hypothetical protein
MGKAKQFKDGLLQRHEVKFRAWDTALMRWSTDFLGVSHHNMLLFYNHKSFGEDYIAIPQDKSRCILNQFIGQLDKNGKEIYEHDILHNVINDSNYVVLWLGHGFYHRRIGKKSGSHIPTHEVEVMGNIYENKELLNES